MKKIESSLSLSRSNLTVEINNARDSEYSYRRLLGRLPEIATMQKPTLDIPMPDSMERAALYAINHNPSLLVSRYNVKGAQALWKQNKKDFYPTLDLEVSQLYNDQDTANAGFDNPDDRFRARLVLNYNIFRGGADSATAQKNISKINQEIEVKRDVKRQVIEGLDLSWNAYEMVALQLKDLRDYKGFSEKTLELYKEEYDLGRRSLLDLLTSQNDVINARGQIITAEYALLGAKYRILDAMGLLPMAIVGNTQEFTSKVNLYADADATEILDTLPVKLDVDGDNIADNEDLCDNSLLENNIMPSGCKKIRRDGDGDGVLDTDDKCPLTPNGADVYPNGCAQDVDMDGVKDYEDECKGTPVGYKVDQKGCAIGTQLTVDFTKSNFIVSPVLDKRISDLATYMNARPALKAKIVAHTQKSELVSQERINVVKNILATYGVNKDRLTASGDKLNASSNENVILDAIVEIEFIN